MSSQASAGPITFPPRQKTFRVVIFDVLVSGENIMDKPSTHTDLFAAMERRGCRQNAIPRKEPAHRLEPPSGLRPALTLCT
ncbi:MAG: hypothetical protein WCA11_03300, partial [Terracidiphilus sp.]